MNKLILIIGAKLRVQGRWARQHLYTLMILSPLVLIISYAAAGRLVNDLSQWLRSPLGTIPLFSFGAGCLIALSLSRSAAEIYNIRSPESVFEALPIEPSVFFHSALATRLARTAIAGLVVLAIRDLFPGTAPLDAYPAAAMCSFVGVAATSEMAAALAWVHWSNARKIGPALLGLSVLVIGAISVGNLLGTGLNPGARSESYLPWPPLAGLVLAVVFYAAGRHLHGRWRLHDIEFARRLQSATRRRAAPLRRLSRKLGPGVSALLARDLRLTARGFSSAVYVVAFVAFLWQVLLLIAFESALLPKRPMSAAYLDATWLPTVLATKVATIVTSATLCGLVPVLVAYEFPHLWLERSTGVHGLDLWQAKLWYARIISSPGSLAPWLLGTLSGYTPAAYAFPLLAECVVGWWIVSSIIGSLSFEMPTRSGVALVLMFSVGIAAGLFAAAVWPFGILIYLYAMQYLTNWGRARTWYVLAGYED